MTLVLCHCWLGHLTRKIVDMTYNVFGGTLNPTQSMCHMINCYFLRRFFLHEPAIAETMIHEVEIRRHVVMRAQTVH